MSVVDFPGTRVTSDPAELVQILKQRDNDIAVARGHIGWYEAQCKNLTGRVNVLNSEKTALLVQIERSKFWNGIFNLLFVLVCLVDLFLSYRHWF